MAQRIEVREAERPDAPDIAEIHLTARHGAMSYCTNLTPIKRRETGLPASSATDPPRGGSRRSNTRCGLHAHRWRKLHSPLCAASLATTRRWVMPAKQGQSLEPPAARALRFSAQHQCEGILRVRRDSVPCSSQKVATKRTIRTLNMNGSQLDEPASLLKLVASLPCAGAFGDRRWRDRRHVAIGPPSLFGRVRRTRPPV